MENRATWSVGVGAVTLLHCICKSTFLMHVGKKEKSMWDRKLE